MDHVAPKPRALTLQEHYELLEEWEAEEWARHGSPGMLAEAWLPYRRRLLAHRLAARGWPGWLARFVANHVGERSLPKAEPPEEV